MGSIRGGIGLPPEAQKWVNSKNDWNESSSWGGGSGTGRGWSGGGDGSGRGFRGRGAGWGANRPVRGWNGDTKWRNWSDETNSRGSWGEEQNGVDGDSYSRSRSLSVPGALPSEPILEGPEGPTDLTEPKKMFYGTPSSWSYKPKIEGSKKKIFSSLPKKVVKANKSTIVVEDPKTHQRKCVICHIEFTSKSHEADHMKGKPHAKNMSKLGLGTPQGTKLMQPKTEGANGKTNVASKSNHKNLLEMWRTGDGLFGKCQLCKIVYSSAQHAVTHLFSTTHTINQNVFNSVKKSVITRKKEKEESEKKRQQLIDETLKAEAKKLWDLKTGNFMKNVIKNEKKDENSKQLPIVKAEGAKPPVQSPGDWKVMYSHLKAYNKRDLSSLDLEEEPPDKTNLEMPPLESAEPPVKKQKVTGDTLPAKEQEATGDNQAENKVVMKKEQKFCTECGERLWPDAKFCGECGGRIGGLPT